MKRHKRHYFEPTDNPKLTRIILVMPKLKPKSKIRRIMWRAYYFKFNN